MSEWVLVLNLIRKFQLNPPPLFDEISQICNFPYEVACPSLEPTGDPSGAPSSVPNFDPSGAPSSIRSEVPSALPSFAPSSFLRLNVAPFPVVLVPKSNITTKIHKYITKINMTKLNFLTTAHTQHSTILYLIVGEIVVSVRDATKITYTSPYYGT